MTSMITPIPSDPATTGPTPRAPWVAHFGFATTPFTKRIAARDLLGRTAHAQAVARIGFCVAEAALGVVCGEVGAGKTVAVRAATSALDRTRYQVIYIPNPTIGTRGLYVAIVAALGGSPRLHKAEVMRQAADLLAAEEAERRRRVVVCIDEAHLLSPEQLEELRLLTNTDMDAQSPFCRHPPRPAHPGPQAPPGRVRRARPAHRHPLHHRPHGPWRVRHLPGPPPAPGRPHRAAVRRRRHRPAAPGRRRAPQKAQQRRHRRADRRRCRQQATGRRHLRQTRRRRTHPRLTTPTATAAPTPPSAPLHLRPSHQAPPNRPHAIPPNHHQTKLPATGVWRGRRVWAPLWPRQDGAAINLPDPDGTKGEEPSVAVERFRERLRAAGLDISWQPTYNAGANPVCIRLRLPDLQNPVVQELLRASFEILAQGTAPWSERNPATPSGDVTPAEDAGE